jgi:hypothetical protein
LLYCKDNRGTTWFDQEIELDLKVYALSLPHRQLNVLLPDGLWYTQSNMHDDDCDQDGRLEQ